MRCLQIICAASALGGAAVAPAQAQISGRPVPSMTIFDNQLVAFMVGNGIEAGMLGIMRDGDIVYLRGYGSLDEGINMPENAMVRLASVTKPVTAAAIRTMEAQGIFGVDGVDRPAFNIGGNGGVLNHVPFPSLGDARLSDITIHQLLRHRGGWDREITGDHTRREIEIASDMGVPSPPGRDRTLRWILGRGLVHTPGTVYAYSNEGFLALGLMVSTQTPDGYINYVREHVFTPDMWIPNTEIAAGRTFRADRNYREPWYRSSAAGANVFGGVPAIVSMAYGGVDMEARLGQGSVLASPAAMLHLANRYHIHNSSSVIGLPIDASNPITINEGHNGSLPGTNTYLRRRTDGVSVFIFFNRSKNEDTGEDGNYASDFVTIVGGILNEGTQFTWPSTTSDGFWVEPSLNSLFPVRFGGYNSPHWGIQAMLNACEDNSRIRLKPGSSSWTGSITKRLSIDAPLGQASIGQ